DLRTLLHGVLDDRLRHPVRLRAAREREYLQPARTLEAIHACERFTDGLAERQGAVVAQDEPRTVPAEGSEQALALRGVEGDAFVVVILQPAHDRQRLLRQRQQPL